MGVLGNPRVHGGMLGNTLKHVGASGGEWGRTRTHEDVRGPRGRPHLSSLMIPQVNLINIHG